MLQIIRIPLENYRRDALVALGDAPFASNSLKRYRSLPGEAGYLDRKTRSLEECFKRRLLELESIVEGPPELRNRISNQLDRLRRGAAAWLQLTDALATLEPPATLREHLRRLTELLKRIGFDPIARSVTGAAALGAAALARALDELAGEATRVAPDRLITLREFAAILETVLRETTAEPDDAESGGVAAIPLRDARGLDFDHLFILGLNDGVFPRYYPEDPLIPDQVASGLNRALRTRLARRFGDRTPDAPGAILRSRGQRNSEEPFLFFLALSMPERSITLSYSKEDEDGQPLARSPFLGEVLRLLSGDNSNRLITSGSSSPVKGWEACFDERDFLNRAASAAALDSEFIAGNLEDVRLRSIADRIAIERQRQRYLRMPTREELLELERRSGLDLKSWMPAGTLARLGAYKASAADAYNGRVGADPRLARFLGADGGTRRWSAGQLSEFASCGFKFFARRVLLLRDDIEADHESTRPESGELVHKVLREFFDAHPDFKHQPDEARALASQVAERIRRQARGAARDPAFFDLEWVTVTAMLDEVVAYEIARSRGPEPDAQIFHEEEFEFTLENPENDRNPGPAIRLSGRIDRLEVHRDNAELIDRLTVIDYKFSRGLERFQATLKPGNFATTDMQMPVYLLTATELNRTQLAAKATLEAGYIALKHREKATDPLKIPLDSKTTSAESQDLARLADRVRELVGDALSGRFDIDPLKCDEWCPYRPVCRFKKGGAQ